MPAITTRERVDIGELQATLTTEQGAMVQVASNFNCLEVPSASTPPNGGFLCDMASVDHTQGPAAVFGPLSAYMLRTHFCFPSPAADAPPTLRLPQEGGLDPTKNVNLLKNVGDYCGVPLTGKLVLSGSEKVMPAGDDPALQPIVDKVCVGLHSDCPVQFGRKGRETFAIPPRSDPKAKYEAGTSTAADLPQWNTVDQVFNASINLHHTGKRMSAPEADAVRAAEGSDYAPLMRICRGLVRASYEGIYLAALLRGRKSLYLTLVGGGVFANPLPVIAEEIVRAHKLYAGHPASQLQEVAICLYSPQECAAVRKLLAGMPQE